MRIKIIYFREWAKDKVQIRLVERTGMRSTKKKGILEQSQSAVERD